MTGRWRVTAYTAVGLVGAAVLVLLMPRPHHPAHPALRSTTPAAGATLARAPSAVEVAFTDPVDTSRSHLSVRDGSGAMVAVGWPRLVAPERLLQPIHLVTSGEVTVVYHVTFVDGAQLAGTLRFRAVPGQGGDGPEAMPDPSAAAVSGDAVAAAAHRHGVDPVSAVLLVADGLVALVAVVLLMRRPQARGPDKIDRAG